MPGTRRDGENSSTTHRPARNERQSDSLVGYHDGLTTRHRRVRGFRSPTMHLSRALLIVVLAISFCSTATGRRSAGRQGADPSRHRHRLGRRRRLRAGPGAGESGAGPARRHHGRRRRRGSRLDRLPISDRGRPPRRAGRLGPRSAAEVRDRGADSVPPPSRRDLQPHRPSR